MQKLDKRIDDLINGNKIKTIWTELECHGASEFLNLIFQEQVEYGSLAHTIIVENNVVCVNLYEGVPYYFNGDTEMLTRMYVDKEDNIIFLSRSGSLFKYETESMDASDLRHYYGRD